MIKHKVNKKSISEITEILKNRGVAVFPTDTVYGIGTIFNNSDGINRIYKIKKRDISKPIIALISDIKHLEKLVDLEKENVKNIMEIIKKYWPGELTIVFNADKNNENNFSKDNTVGVRIPKEPMLLNIIEACGGIILTTSANISGENSPVKISDISDNLLEKVDFILDDGTISNGIPSTVIKYTDNKIAVLREGNIKKEQILNLLKRRAEDK